MKHPNQFPRAFAALGMTTRRVQPLEKKNSRMKHRQVFAAPGMTTRRVHRLKKKNS
jgi:hypothetical protein